MEQQAKEMTQELDLMERGKMQEWDRIRSLQQQNVETMNATTPAIAETRIQKKTTAGGAGGNDPNGNDDEDDAREFQGEKGKDGKERA